MAVYSPKESPALEVGINLSSGNTTLLVDTLGFLVNNHCINEISKNNQDFDCSSIYEVLSCFWGANPSLLMMNSKFQM